MHEKADIIVDKHRVAAATNAVTNLSGATLGNVTLVGAGIVASTINSTGKANTTAVIDLLASKTITINADANLTAASIATTAASSSLIVKGAAAKINVGILDSDITTVDASGLNAGGLTATLTTGVTSFKGGAGADAVTTAAVTGAAGSIDGGAGADRLIVAVATDVDSAAKAARFVNFEEVASNGVNLDLSTFASVTKIITQGTTTLDKVSAALAGNIVVNGGATPTINVIGATNVGQLDTIALTVSDEVAAKSTIALGNINAAGVETININAVDNATVTLLTGATALTNMNLSGAGDFIVTTGALALNVNTKIDASAATGTVTINATAATTNGVDIIGTASAKVNTLTGSAQADKLTGGAGDDILSGLAGNDIIIGNAGKDTITGGLGADTLTGGADADVFVFTTLVDSLVGAAAVTGGDSITDFVSGVDDFKVGGTIAAAVATTGGLKQGATYTAAGTGNLGTDIGAAITAGGAMIASGAAVVTITGTGAGTYLVINDAVGIFDASADAVIQLIGTSSTTLVAGDFIA
ncbi:hypothetical protein CR159_20160 [Pollutimonas subterranea]|uniref:Hemolysin type calcium-binding protein n=1 Tax=Pollutimonas subterranea TaxID=2045210 RepID=A0A2N4TZ51_9BURK|nr:calcium-binding protein [Pollutimonas subterranea]PLC48043.1 hypothetical protein CR159_20160 [Pollutimonas subterranea]